jgi:hypothetical protein
MNTGVAKLNDELTQFNKEAEMLSNLSSIFGNLWFVYRHHIWLIWKSRRLIKIMRMIMSICSELCENAACLEKFYPMIQTLRDNFVKMHTTSLKYKTLAPLRWSLKKTVDEWDDLAEDCAISLDPEIRRLMFKIADAL